MQAFKVGSEGSDGTREQRHKEKKVGSVGPRGVDRMNDRNGVREEVSSDGRGCSKLRYRMT